MIGWLLKYKEPFFICNPGNAGDAAIASASAQLFRKISYDIKQSTAEKITAGSNIIIGGGGNFIEDYSDVKLILEKCLEKNVNQCVLLPHTIRRQEETLAALDNRFTLMCRDLSSYFHVCKFAPRATALLARDIVLDLNIQELEARVCGLRHRVSLCFDTRWLKKVIRWKRALKRIQPDPTGTLTIFRSDGESAFSPPADRRFDLMAHYGVSKYGAGCDQVTMDIVRLLRTSSRVVTDRLHVSLLAATAGVMVCIVDNNYGKNYAVWDLALNAENSNTFQGNFGGYDSEF